VAFAVPKNLEAHVARCAHDSAATAVPGGPRSFATRQAAPPYANAKRFCTLTRVALSRYRRYMSQSILVFNFGANEEAAQQAKRKVEAWKQGFRLGNKMLLKFEREGSAVPNEDKREATEAEASEQNESAKSSAAKSGKKKAGSKTASKSGANAKESPEPEPAAAANGEVRLFLRLDFSDHEKLSHQRWLDRIPTEEPFKSASGETIRTGDPEFPKTAERFEDLE